MFPLTLAIMSDLHAGSAARTSDLRPPGTQELQEQGFLEDLEKFFRSQDITADYLIVPGDLTDSGRPDEFQVASTAIQRLMKGLSVEDDHLIFAPGNHDIDWAPLKADPADRSGFRHHQCLAPLRDGDFHVARVMQAKTPSVIVAPYAAALSDERILAVLVNSAGHDHPQHKIHHGLVSDEALSALRSELEGQGRQDTRLRLCVVHHHPIAYSDPISSEPDFSAMVNAESLLSLLDSFSFDILIHGHKHAPRLRTQIVDSGHPLTILASGSLSAVLDNRWAGLINNQFHRLIVEGRSPNGEIFGTLQSWCYLSGRKWLPSSIHNGIAHRLPFGPFVSPPAVQASVEDYLLSNKDRQYIRWTEIVASNSHLRHLPPERVVQCVDAVATQYGYERHGDLPEEMLLLAKDSE